MLHAETSRKLYIQIIPDCFDGFAVWEIAEFLKGTDSFDVADKFHDHDS